MREYPWQVAMFTGSRYHCGASIISEWHMLTAAHCVQPYRVNPSVLKLSLGDWNLKNSHDGAYKAARIKKVAVHPGYSRLTLQNDLAVLTLQKPIKFTERIRPVCLPTHDMKTDGLRATVTGWGRDENKKLKSKLQEHEASIITNSKCSAQWVKKKAPSNFIQPSMLCMDASQGDSCNGDSGGPLVTLDRNRQKWIQVGLVSFGSGSCKDRELAGVYTRLSKYLTWINEQIQK